MATDSSTAANTRWFVLGAAAALLQAIFLYAAVFVRHQVWPLPAPFALAFAILGAGCLAGMILSANRILSAPKPEPAIPVTPGGGEDPLRPPRAPRPALPPHENRGTEMLWHNLGKNSAAEYMGVYKPTFRFVWTEHGAKKEAALSEFPICIGRDPKVCHIVVNDASVSRKHAKISFDESGFFVEDAGSSNGTKADGVNVLAKTALSPGCEIELGLVRMRIYNG